MLCSNNNLGTLKVVSISKQDRLCDLVYKHSRTCNKTLLGMIVQFLSNKNSSSRRLPVLSIGFPASLSYQIILVQQSRRRNQTARVLGLALGTWHGAIL